jgi:PAS domain S-box-containing protein
VNQSAPPQFIASLAMQRQRLTQHAGDALMSGPGGAVAPDAVDRLSQAFLSSLELIKATEEELREMHALLEETRSARARAELLFDRAPAALVLTTTDTTIRSANRAAAALLGRESSQLLGREVRAMVPASQRRGFKEQLAHVIAAGEASAWSFDIEPGNNVPMTVKAVVNVIDDPVGPQRSLFWSFSAS